MASLELISIWDILRNMFPFWRINQNFDYQHFQTGDIFCFQKYVHHVVQNLIFTLNITWFNTTTCQ